MPAAQPGPGGHRRAGAEDQLARGPRRPLRHRAARQQPDDLHRPSRLRAGCACSTTRSTRSCRASTCPICATSSRRTARCPATVYMGVDFFTSRASPIFDVPPARVLLRPRRRLALRDRCPAQPRDRLVLAAQLRRLARAVARRASPSATTATISAISAGRSPTRCAAAICCARSSSTGRRSTGRATSTTRSCRRSGRELRAAFPDTRFVVFTTPESAPLFSLMVQLGHLPGLRALAHRPRGRLRRGLGLHRPQQRHDRPDQLSRRAPFHAPGRAPDRRPAARPAAAAGARAISVGW